MATFTPLDNLPKKKTEATVESNQNPNEIPSLSELAGGVTSAGASLISGIVTTPLAGLYGSFKALKDYKNDPYLEGAAETIKYAQDKFVYSPKEGSVGEDILKVLAVPFEGLDQMATEAGNATVEATGNPELATGAYTAVNSLPDLLGLKLKPKGTGANIVERGNELRGTSKGDNIVTVQAAVNSARKRDYDHATSLFDEIKDLPPNYIDRRDIQGLPGVIRNTIQDKTAMTGITLDEMPSLKALINDLENLKTVDRKSIKGKPDLLEPSARTPKRDMGIEPHVVLSDLMEIRKQATAKYTPNLAKRNPSEHLALGLAIKQMDNHIDSLFNSDMVSGSTDSIGKWKKARSVWADYKKRFDENKVIQDLGDASATPEQVVNWIYGASDLSLKPEAAATVKRIKDIIGKDSEAFYALQNEYLFKMLTPLLEDVPKLDTFVKRYENQVKNNKGLLDEIGIDTKELDKLAKSAKRYSVTAKDMGKSFNLDRSAAIMLLSAIKKDGNSSGMAFAKSALQINLLTRAFETMRSIKDIRKKKDILVDFLNYDAYSPLLTNTASRMGSVGETLRNEGDLREQNQQAEEQTPAASEKVINSPSRFKAL